MAVSVATLLPTGGGGQPAQPPPQETAPAPAPGRPDGAPAESGGAAPAARPSPGPAPVPAEWLLDRVNAERRAAGLGPLSPHPGIAAIAAEHALEMAARGELFHNDAYFSTDVRRRLGAGALGENVARNTDLEDAHRRLMASPGHRANITDARFSLAGFAVVATPDGVLYVTEDFAAPGPVPAALRPPAAVVARRAAPAAPPPPAPAPEFRLVPAAPALPARPAAADASGLLGVLAVLVLGAVLPVGPRPRPVPVRSAGPGGRR